MKEVDKILLILENKDEETQMKIISEVASRIGTEKWRTEVLDLIKRMGM